MGSQSTEIALRCAQGSKSHQLCCACKVASSSLEPKHRTSWASPPPKVCNHWQILDCKMLSIVKGASQGGIWGWDRYSLFYLLNQNISTFTSWLKRSSRVFTTCWRIKNDLACLTAPQQTGTNPWELSPGTIILFWAGWFQMWVTLSHFSHTQISAVETGDSLGGFTSVDWWHSILQV